MLTVEIIDEYGTDDIEAFLLSDSRSLIYSSRHYIKLIAHETGSTARWITVSDESGLRGALPLLIKNGALGPVVNSLAYYGSNGGVMTKGDDTEAKLAAIRAFTAFCEQADACASTLITNPLLGDHALYETHLPYDLRDERIGQFTVFPLDQQANSLMRLFADPRPRNIRKAQRSGVQVTASQSSDAIAFLHATHDQNIKSIGGLPKRLAFFERIPELLPADSWKIYLAEHEGKRIAALLLLYYNLTVEYYTPCVVEEHRPLQALPLMIYQAMVDAMKAGYRQWNWGGTWLSQGGVYAFKKKWGTTDIPYYYFTRVRSSAVRVATRDTLLREYPGFFVLPFSNLKAKSAEQEIT
ncbi:MAG: GNAT family N-acetyltransferase [Burkholderiales bacterium]|nr:GNAT family N-acetyltransferase [Burkholderiales bacterium]